MKVNVSAVDMQEALSRVERARAAQSKAAQRLKRAQDAVRSASEEVAQAEEEVRASASNLDQIVQRNLKMAMKKGGTDISIALAELIARSLGDSSTGAEDEGGTLPLPEPASAPSAPATRTPPARTSGSAEPGAEAPASAPADAAKAA